MSIKKLLVSLLITLTILSSAVFAFGCGGTKGLVYELNEDESGYVVTGFGEDVEEYPEILEIPAKYKGKTVTKIGTMAFRNITEFKTVILPEGLEEIGASAFRGCSNIETLNFPSTLKKYGTQVFYGCKKLPSVVIPEGMTVVPASFIYGCEAITELTIPNGVTEIQEKAFGKTSIKKLALPNSVTEIAKNAFMEANKLEEVSTGNGVKKIGSFVFDGCEALNKVTLGSGLRVIESNAFNNCTALESIVIPEGVRAIMGNAFKGCTKLTSITLVGATSTKCENPACGVTICPASKEMGLTCHYHSSKWLSSESESSAFGHMHWIFSHDIADPANAAKLLVTSEVRTMHNHALGGQGSYWSYSEQNDKYYFKGKLEKEDDPYRGTNVDEDIRAWHWDDSRGYILYNGTKGAWYE